MQGGGHLLAEIFRNLQSARQTLQWSGRSASRHQRNIIPTLLQTCRVTTATSASSGLIGRVDGSEATGMQRYHAQSIGGLSCYETEHTSQGSSLFSRLCSSRARPHAAVTSGLILFVSGCWLVTDTNLEPMTSILQQHLIVPAGECVLVLAAIVLMRREGKSGRCIGA